MKAADLDKDSLRRPQEYIRPAKRFLISEKGYTPIRNLRNIISKLCDLPLQDGFHTEMTWCDQFKSSHIFPLPRCILQCEIIRPFKYAKSESSIHFFRRYVNRDTAITVSPSTSFSLEIVVLIVLVVLLAAVLIVLVVLLVLVILLVLIVLLAVLAILRIAVATLIVIHVFVPPVGYLLQELVWQKRTKNIQKPYKYFGTIFSCLFRSKVL